MKEKLSRTQHTGRDWLPAALDFCLERTRHNLERLSSFPERIENEQWLCVDNGGWVGGHWVGLLWLAYAYSGEPVFQEAAEKWAARLAPRQYDITTHDLGFLFELSHVLGFRLTDNQALKAPALQAAQTLARRFNPAGRFLQAWGPLDAPAELRGRTIVDTMMNLDLLFWASQASGEVSLAQIAQAHAQTCLTYHVRPDYSTAHVADFDPHSGTFLKQDTHQGLSPTSCWSRGQSWTVYGFGDCYRATGETGFFEAAHGLAKYALQRLPPDHVPYWDYASPDIPEDVRDSSAAAILASGLLKLAQSESEAGLESEWHAAAQAILASLWQNYSSRQTNVPSILLHGTRSRPHGMQDHGLIYGDYYFMEGLLILQGQPAILKALI
ncbi:MAG: glucuronyl hydrolase [Chloroflexota bacterium]